MFAKEVYINRRRSLVEKMRLSGERGLLIFMGNIEVPSQGSVDCNGYNFRQDSNWLYFIGLDMPRWAGIIDIDSGEASLYADDYSLDDIIWMGPQPSVEEQAQSVGISKTDAYSVWGKDIEKAIKQGRQIHFLPPLRYYNLLRICEATGYSPEAVKSVAKGPGPHASESFIKAVVSLRLVKEACEIEELDKAGDFGYDMHIAGRKAIRIGVNENDIYAAMDGVASRVGWGRSFTTILSQHGETLHNIQHYKEVEAGKLMVIDAGLETFSHYASDHTRTYPTSGRFSQRQREVYQIVCDCNELAFSLTRPGITYREVHLATARKMLEGLSALNLVRGDIDEMVAEGIAGLFMPHGLGHNIGLDVHDMEDLGEDYVGYDSDQTRAPQLGLGNLRMARRLAPGNVISDEPGIYFIPGLIEKFKREGLGYDFVNYGKLESYYGFGGIRLEDDVLVTESGARRLGTKRLPIEPSDVENAMLCIVDTNRDKDLYSSLSYLHV